MNASLVIFAVIFLSVLPANAADEPDPRGALIAFEKFKEHYSNRFQSTRWQSQIEHAIGGASLYSRSLRPNTEPILVLVYFSRTHFAPGTRSFQDTLGLMRDFINRGPFSRHLYQFSDLHPDQARQGIWEMGQDDSIMRIEIVPENCVVVSFFALNDWHAAQDLVRRTLVPPRML